LNNDGAHSKINKTNNIYPDGVAGVERRVKMEEQPNELKKLSAIATDLGFASELRTKAIEQMGSANSHEALRALLDLAANDQLTVKERELALKQALKIIKSSPE
jgi:hypothetical protein